MNKDSEFGAQTIYIGPISKSWASTKPYFGLHFEMGAVYFLSQREDLNLIGFLIWFLSKGFNFFIASCLEKRQRVPSKPMTSGRWILKVSGIVAMYGLVIMYKARALPVGLYLPLSRRAQPYGYRIRSPKSGGQQRGIV